MVLLIQRRKKRRNHGPSSSSKNDCSEEEAPVDHLDGYDTQFLFFMVYPNEFFSKINVCNCRIAGFAISHNNCIISCLPLASICERSECRTDYISFTSMGRPQEPFFKKYQMDLQKGLLQIFVYLERILESMQVSRSLDWKSNKT